MGKSFRKLIDKNNKPLIQKNIQSQDNDWNDEASQANIGKLVSHLQQYPQTMSPGNMLVLQHQIGNQAIQRMINQASIQRDPTQSSSESSESSAPVRPAHSAPTRNTPARPARSAPARSAPARPDDTTIIPPLETFKAKILLEASKAQASPKNNSDIQLSEDNKKLKIEDSLTKVLTAYREFNDKPITRNKVFLSDAIHHFLVYSEGEDDMRQLGLNSPDIRSYLNRVMSSIETSLPPDYRRQDSEAIGLVSGGQSSNTTQDVTKEQFKKLQSHQKLLEVGIPQEFILASTTQATHLKNLKLLIEVLEKKQLSKARKLLAELHQATLPGFALIKSLILTKFPEAAGIEDFQSTTYQADTESKAGWLNPMTQSKDLEDPNYLKEEKFGMQSLQNSNAGSAAIDKELSPAERLAIINYSGDSFDAMNATLRGNNLETGMSKKDIKRYHELEMKWHADEGLSGEENAEFTELSKMKLKQDTDQRNMKKSRTLVSAMNKLPKYQGLAYRMMNNFADFEATIFPGATFADTGFMSASKTLEGAEIGGTSGAGSKAGALNIYEIIHSKKAAQITFLSSARKETEVLFNPGSRFKVIAIWEYGQDGQIPDEAPSEAKRILLRTGAEKERTIKNPKTSETHRGKVRVVEMAEI